MNVMLQHFLSDLQLFSDVLGDGDLDFLQKSQLSSLI